MKNSKLSPRQRLLFIVMTIIAIAGFAYWLTQNLRWEETEIDQGYSSAAKKNPFLAAEIFLRKHGVPATTVKNLSLLDSHRWRNLRLQPDDTIVLINANKTLTQDRYERLYEWLANGGTLITSPQNPYIGTHTREQDLLLQDFEITPGKTRFEAEQEFSAFDSDEKNTDEHNAGDDETDQTTDGNNEKNKQPENYYRCNLKEDPTEIEFADNELLQFDFTREPPFFYQDNSVSDSDMSNNWDSDSLDSESLDSDSLDSHNQESDSKSTHMLSFAVDNGRLSITSDTGIWSNQRIDCHDHAYALWRMTNHNGRVWFLINQDAPSLAVLLWQNAPYGVLAAVLALLLWLWAKSQRFGPVFERKEIARRSLTEHIYASAMLLWRNQQHGYLLTRLRQQLIAHLLAQHPQVAVLDNTGRAAFLHELTGMNRDLIERVLYADDLQNPQDFADAIAHLQTIRKQL